MQSNMGKDKPQVPVSSIEEIINLAKQLEPDNGATYIFKNEQSGYPYAIQHALNKWLRKEEKTGIFDVSWSSPHYNVFYANRAMTEKEIEEYSN